jgi:glutathione peroxidase
LGENQVLSIYSIKVKTIDGVESDLEDLKGKVLLVVNVASKCGYTSQYKGLQRLHEKYHEGGLQILGFPCNDFSKQEPDLEPAIKQFCETNYKLAFNLYSKIQILGTTPHPLFKLLQEAQLKSKTPSELSLFTIFRNIKYMISQKKIPSAHQVQWNFHKFLVNKKGIPVTHFSSQTDPEDSALTSRIEEELKN